MTKSVTKSGRASRYTKAVELNMTTNRQATGRHHLMLPTALGVRRQVASAGSMELTVALSASSSILAQVRGRLADEPIVELEGGRRTVDENAWGRFANRGRGAAEKL